MSEEDTTIVEKKGVGDRQPEFCSSCGQPQFPAWLNLAELWPNVPETYEEWRAQNPSLEEMLAQDRSAI